MKTKFQAGTIVALEKIESFGITIQKSESSIKCWWAYYLLEWRKGNQIAYIACRIFKENDMKALKNILPEEEPTLFAAIEEIKHPMQLEKKLDIKGIIERHIPKEPPKKVFTFSLHFPSLKRLIAKD